MTPCFVNKWTEGKLKRYYYYRCTSTHHKSWQACPVKQVNADRLENYILENLERISLDKNYVENLVFKLNHNLKSSNPEFKKLRVPQEAGFELTEVCSKFSKFSPETIVSVIKSFLSFLSQGRGVERNLLAKQFIKEIFYSKETIKITLFYSENSKNFLISDNKENPALLSQGRANFSGRNETISFPPQQSKFVSESVGARIKRFQTFSIILPNLTHKSRKLNLNR